MPPAPPLRAYQREPFEAILRAAYAHDADIITVRMSRQAGKNEVSARAEGALMAACYSRREQLLGVKGAPTQTPQAVRSLSRLAAHLRRAGFSKRRHDLRAGGDTVALGSTTAWWFGSGEEHANVVGGTATHLLEIDEAQDFNQEKHNKDYSPMAAAAAAARVYYGTAWSDFDLLENMRQEALDRERRDGRRRVFDVRWERVAEEVPAYALFVQSEIARLGHTAERPHPIILTQYELIPQAGAGRLFNPAQLAALQGDHPALEAPASASHATYAAGVDVGGANLSGAADPDETVLTVGRVLWPGRGRHGGDNSPTVHAVRQYAWQGVNHEALWPEIIDQLRRWRVSHVAVDATGIGEPLATHLQARLGEDRVTAFKFTTASKSSLGHDLLAAVNLGQAKVWRPDGPHHEGLWQQLRRARREYKPGGRLDWYCDASESHDDRLTSFALLIRAASRGKPRAATQRSF